MYKNETFEDNSGDDLIKYQKWEWDFGIGKNEIWKMETMRSRCGVSVSFCE